MNSGNSGGCIGIVGLAVAIVIALVIFCLL